MSKGKVIPSKNQRGMNMNKMERVLLKEFEGQTIETECEVCNRKTKFKVERNGIIRCLSCGFQNKLDVSDVAKYLKSIGIDVM